MTLRRKYIKRGVGGKGGERREQERRWRPKAKLIRESDKIRKNYSTDFLLLGLLPQALTAEVHLEEKLVFQCDRV